MSMRVSTRGFHNAAIAEILAQQAKLSRTQSQVASGKRVQTPADDPIAATRILDIERSRSQSEQYGRNAAVASSRLGVAEQALSDVGDLLQRAHQLAVQANNGSLDSTSLASIATELRARSQELQDIANRRDASGSYLFSGFSTQTQPFARNSAGVDYAGDQGVRSLQISATQRINDGFSGSQVFMDVPEGNGTFAVAVGTHTGTGSVDNGQVADPALWAAAPAPREYTIAFTAPGAWEVLDSNGDPLLDGGVPVTGTHSDGGVIEFNGIRVTVRGVPAAGDTFEIAPAGRESVFTTLDNMIAALTAEVDTPESRAQLGTAMNRALAQLSQGLDHVIDTRAEVGARLSALDNAETMRADLELELEGTLSDLSDLDYAEAVGRMNQQLVGLQSAQAAYGRIAQLSLFDYLT